MFRVKIITIGKTKEPWLELALEEYENRLKRTLAIDWILARDLESFERFVQKEKSYIALDPKGQCFSSEKFSSWFMQQLINGKSRLVLIIGGAEGIPAQILQQAQARISLSPLTFTHQLTRLVLLEQIYRAFEITKGSPYHK